jgi:hypothetical protein
LCPNNKHGLGSVDGCGDAETPGMKRSESDGVVGSCGVRLDFFNWSQESANANFSVPLIDLYVARTTFVKLHGNIVQVLHVVRNRVMNDY